MFDWQSESDLDSIRNSCDVFVKELGRLLRPAGKATEQRAEKRKPAKHSGGRKHPGAVYLGVVYPGAKTFRWERASSLLLTASISHFWTMSCAGEEERQLLGHLDPSGRVQQRQHRLPCSFLPGSKLKKKFSSSRGKMIIVHLSRRYLIQRTRFR